MRTNFLIPVIAMMFAIGIALASPAQDIDPTQDYIWMDGGFLPLGKEINCGTGYLICEVRLPNGQLQKVYDAADPQSLKTGDGIPNQL